MRLDRKNILFLFVSSFVAGGYAFDDTYDSFVETTLSVVSSSSSSEKERTLVDKYDYPFQLKSMKLTDDGDLLCVTSKGIRQGSGVMIDTCNNDNKRQFWITDKYSRLRLKEKPYLCKFQKEKFLLSLYKT